MQSRMIFLRKTFPFAIRSDKNGLSCSTIHTPELFIPQFFHGTNQRQKQLFHVLFIFGVFSSRLLYAFHCFAPAFCAFHLRSFRPPPARKCTNIARKLFKCFFVKLKKNLFVIVFVLVLLCFQFCSFAAGSARRLKSIMQTDIKKFSMKVPHPVGAVCAAVAINRHKFSPFCALADAQKRHKLHLLTMRKSFLWR